MEDPLIVINTAMTKEDYKKFLYIAAFRRNKFVIPLICIICLVGSLIISFDEGNINFIMLIISWPLLFILSIVVVMFKIERKNSQRIKTDKTGTFDSINTLKFYDYKIVMETQSIKSTGELNYNQFFSVMESKAYFIFYFTYNQASLIRKKDVSNIDEFKEFIIEKFECKYKRI